MALTPAEHLKGRNVNGGRGKVAIEKKYVDLVIEALHTFYGDLFTNNAASHWTGCVTAMDKMNRESRSTYCKNR